MEIVHLIYIILNLVCSSSHEGVYPAALPSPVPKWGHGERNGGSRIPLKGSKKRSDGK